MPDIKTHYERYLLAAAGLLAAAVAAALVWAGGAARDAAALPVESSAREPFAAATEVETLSADYAQMEVKRTLRESTNGASPFVSRIYLLKEGRLVDILESGNDLFQNIPNAWILENELDYLDADLPQRDPDGDSFTNLEEFAAKTDPRSDTSRPAAWTKLRLGEVKIEQLQIIFTGKDYKGRANINSVAATADSLQGKPVGPTTPYAPNDASSPLKVRRYKAGFQSTYDEEEIPFKLVGFKEEMRANPNITLPDGSPQMDRIEMAILESTSGDGTKVELEAGRAETSPYSLAQLIDVRPGGKTQEIRTGATFELEPGGRYKLVDVSEEKATIEDLATREQHSVPKIEESTLVATPEDTPTP